MYHANTRSTGVSAGTTLGNHLVAMFPDRVDKVILDGVVNLAAPEASDNRTLMRDLRTVLGVPIGLPATRWMLELGTFAIRTETELVLKSRWVVPERLLGAGFRFEHTALEPTLRSILRR